MTRLLLLSLTIYSVTACAPEAENTQITEVQTTSVANCEADAEVCIQNCDLTDVTCSVQCKADYYDCIGAVPAGCQAQQAYCLTACPANSGTCAAACQTSYNQCFVTVSPDPCLGDTFDDCVASNCALDDFACQTKCMYHAQDVCGLSQPAMTYDQCIDMCLPICSATQGGASSLPNADCDVMCDQACTALTN